MATSGSKTVSVTSWDSLVFSWSVSGQSVANNTSTVKWTLKLVSTSSGRIDSSVSKAWSVTVNGTKYSGTNTVGISNNSTKTLASGTTVISHGSDGSKFFSYSFSQEFNITFSGSSIGTISGSGSGTLDTIPRASQPSCITWPEHTQNVGEFGDQISIHMNRKSDTFTHTVRYQFGSQSGTIATGVTTGTTWTIPLTLMNLIPNATKGSGTIYVDTYNGSTKIGTKSCGFTATVPSSVKPTCSFTLEDITGIDDVYGSPVKGLSKIKITVSSTLAYSSPIVSCTITANGAKYSGTTATTGLLQTSGSSVVKATVTDKRGRTGTVSYTMTVQDYSSPSVDKLTVIRCDSDGTENDQGESVKVTFSATVSSMSSKNTATYKLKYKKSTDTTWTEVALSALVNTYTVTNKTHIFSADGNNAYDVELVVTDRHRSVTRTTSVSTAFTLYNCHPSGTGWRFGGVAEEEDTLQNDLALHQVGNSYAFQPDSFSGEKGYIKLATITLNTLNVNAPIVFTINRRGGLCPMTVYIRFASSSTTTDPDLASITYDGDNFGAFMVKNAVSTWTLYVDNTSGWSNPCLQSWYTTDNQMSRLSVVFPNGQVAGTDPSVLKAESVDDEYFRATPAKMQSILDFIYPVGSIYLSYSHVNPGTLFGGTWERIENAFLWAVDASGTIGQTGGEKTHALTVAELPSHNHTISVANTATGSNAASNKIRYNGSDTSYLGTLATNTTGSGDAHNNMPPYIQVSAWRRTA